MALPAHLRRYDGLIDHLVGLLVDDFEREIEAQTRAAAPTPIDAAADTEESREQFDNTA